MALLAFSTVLVTARMLRLMGLIVNKGVALSQIGEVLVSILPGFLELAIPMSALLAVMMTFARLSGDSELIVVRASGISLAKLVKPVAIFALGTFLLCLVVSLHLRTWGNNNLAKVLYEIARSRSTAAVEPGVFVKMGDLTVYSEEVVHQTGGLSRVLIDDRRDQEQRKIVVAKDGVISSNDSTRSITFTLSDGEIHEILEGKYVRTAFNQNVIDIPAEELLSSDAERKGRRTEEMYIGELNRNIDELQERQSTGIITPENTLSVSELEQQTGWRLTSIQEIEKRINRMRVELGRRASFPFAALILPILAMPLGVHSPRTQRSWGLSLSITIGATAFISYYAILSIAMAFAESGTLSPTVALWTPNILSLLAAMYLVKLVTSERLQSIEEGIALMASKVRRRRP